MKHNLMTANKFECRAGDTTKEKRERTDVKVKTRLKHFTLLSYRYEVGICDRKVEF